MTSSLPDDLKTIIGDAAWDVVLVGDGSGSRYGYAGGWATLLFDGFSGLRKLFYGSISDTTVNVCELSPYVYAMLWYHNGPARLLRNQIKEETNAGIAPRLIQIHIITDCDIIARQGNKEAKADANAPLWKALFAYESLGYQFHWHWIPRETAAANRLCDSVSKSMRIANKELDTPDIYDDSFMERPDVLRAE